VTTAAWLILASVLIIAAARIGYLAGREGAEAHASATIADLRTALRKSMGARYLSDEAGRPE
jgi:hypothetical protein